MLKRPKVAFVCQELIAGGPQSWVLTLTPHLISKNIDVHIVSLVLKSNSNPKLESAFLELDVPITKIDYHGGAPKKAKGILKLIREMSRYDSVHSNCDIHDGLIMFCAALTGVPQRISHARNSRFFDQTEKPKLHHRALQTIIKHFATILFGVSRESADALHGKHHAVHKGPYTIPSAIAFEAIEHLKLTGDIGVIPAKDSKIFRVGHIGRFCPQKNHRFLLEIYASILSLKRDSCLILIGSGPLENEITNLVEKKGLQNKVIFLPPTRNVLTLLKFGFDLLLFPSLWEGTPRVVAEAQAAGIPVVCSDAIPIESIFNPNLCRRISLNRSAHEWAKNCIEIVEASKDWPLGHQIESSSKAIFEIREQSNKLAEIYNES